MANRTVKDAHTIKGTNPQYLVEKIIRTRIYDSKYWKEECFALSADLVVDKGIALRFIGGIYGGNIKPTPFLCLILKLLQIQPDKDIIIEFIRQEDYKYVRALGAVYMRLTGSSTEIYKYLEPLYNDYRKLRIMNKTGEFALITMDDLVDQLLREERVCDVQMPRLQKREILEEAGQLEPRTSTLDEDLDVIESESDTEAAEAKLSSGRSKVRRSPARRDRARRTSRSPSIERRHKSPVRSHKDRDHDRRGRDHSDRADRGRVEKDSRRDRKRTREDSYEREIREANELRARIGLRPLDRDV